MKYAAHLANHDGDMGNPISVPDAEFLFKNLASGDGVAIAEYGALRVVGKHYFYDWGGMVDPMSVVVLKKA